MSWQPITDLPANWNELVNQQLLSMVTVWQEQAERLRQSGAFKEYMDRLHREIAIETGIIERLYTIDRGITQLLIEHGIQEALIPHEKTDRPVKQVVAMIKDQETAIKGLFDFVGGQRTLSTSYTKELHQVLTRNQPYTEALNPLTGQVIEVPLLRGDWKKHPNNPQRPNGMLYEYAPPEQVASEMDKLIAWHRQHQESTVSPEVEAAWLHHRFTQIHPFQDGNGRVARCLASLVFIKAGWFPLVLTRDDRASYITALEQADHGDLSSLVELFAKRQRRAFTQSLALSEQVLSQTRRTKMIIASIADRLKQDKEITEQVKIEKAESYAALLFESAANRLQEIADDIRLSLANVVINDAQVFTVQAPAGDDRSYYHRYQVIETANQLGYYANLRRYHSWLQLVIDVERPTILLFSFHVLGKEARGLLACSASAYHRDLTEEGERTINEIQALTEEPFQFSYADEPDNLAERFKLWLETAIVSGLDYWNKSL